MGTIPKIDVMAGDDAPAKNTSTVRLFLHNVAWLFALLLSQS